MIVDQNLRFDSANALTSGTVYSTNTVDLSIAREIGEGDDLYGILTVGSVAFSGGTSILAEVVVSDAANLSSNTTVVGTFGTLLTASLTAKAQFVCRINPILASLGKRYLGIRYTITGTYSAGSVTSDIATDIQDGKKFHASGFAVQ